MSAMRTITSVLFGNKDVRESNEVSPYGWDSCPIAGVVAVYADTYSKGDNIVLGYANKNQIATEGQSRMYSTDTAGALKYFVYCKDNQILIGTGTPTNHFTQWEALNTQLQSSVVNFINTQLPLIATGIAGGGGSYTPGTMSLNITTAKTDNILTN